MMFLFTNKKVIGVWTFEVSCITWMEKSEVVQKTLQWKYRLISITSYWYHIISLVIGITFICFCTAKYKINRFITWRYTNATLAGATSCAKKSYLLNCLGISDMHPGMGCPSVVQNNDSSNGFHVFHIVYCSVGEHTNTSPRNTKI